MLIAGLVVFLGIHLVPAAPRLKDSIDFEALVVVAGIVAWALFARFHGALFGVPVLDT